MHPTRGAQVHQQNRDKSDLLAHPAHWRGGASVTVMTVRSLKNYSILTTSHMTSLDQGV